jgi:hypothetical protein
MSLGGMLAMEMSSLVGEGGVRICREEIRLLCFQKDQEETVSRVVFIKNQVHSQAGLSGSYFLA